MDTTKYNNRLFLLTVILGMVFSLIQIPGDLQYINQNQGIGVKFYLIGRIILFLSFVTIFVLKFSKKYIVKDNDILLVATLLTIYACHGQLFLPGYFMAYMQSIIAYSLFFALPKKKFTPLLIGSGFLMILSVCLSDVTYASDEVLSQKFKIDVSISIFIINVLSYFGYKFITVAQHQKNIMSDKFLEVGRHAAMVVHDLKGVMFSPRIYINLMEQKIRENKINDLPKIMESLKTEYEYLTDYVKSLNNLSKISNEISELPAREILDSIIFVFFRNTLLKENVDIKVEGTLKTNEYYFRSIVINLLKNSIENFDIKKQKDKKVFISVKNNEVIFKDNGGGFSQDALNKIKSEDCFTEKKEGTGLGLFLVRNYINQTGGKVIFYNENDCAVVKLTLK